MLVFAVISICPYLLKPLKDEDPMPATKNKEIPKDIQKRIKENLKAGPEQTLVVGPLVECLVSLGWKLEQIWYGKKEWKIPKNPSEATKCVFRSKATRIPL